MSAPRFTSDVNHLRAALRGRHGADLITTLRRAIEQWPVAALAADNAQRYVAANAAARKLTGYTQAELLTRTVMDLTPLPKTPVGQKLWEAFIGQGGQRGEYDLSLKSGARQVRYWAFASVAPGIHLSLLEPVDAAADGIAAPHGT